MSDIGSEWIVHLHRTAAEMRRQIDGLSQIAKGVMQMDPVSCARSVYINVRRKQLKFLVWGA